jgi:hypothetical protein
MLFTDISCLRGTTGLSLENLTEVGTPVIAVRHLHNAYLIADQLEDSIASLNVSFSLNLCVVSLDFHIPLPLIYSWY